MRTLIRLCLLIIAAFICSIIFSTPQSASAQANCTVCISEFRTRGPGNLSSTAGSAFDEFIELYNNTDSDINISGYKFKTADNAGGAATQKVAIPANTTLPARGHYLIACTNGSSAGNYASSLGVLVASNLGYGTGISDDNGLAITDSADVVLDQVGMSSGTVLKEGTFLPPIVQGSAGASQQFSYVRKVNTVTNYPQDTGDNTADFVLVVADTTANLTSKYGSQKMTLGAPGPENLTSPIESDAKFTGVLYDNTVAASQSPNRCYDPQAGGGTVGSLFIRRNVTNNSAPTNQLRLRVVDITTATNPATTGKAILKPMTSTGTGSTGCPIPNGFATPQATTLDAPSVAANGGLNSTLSVTPTIPVGVTQPLEYKLAADRTGTFTFLFIYEAK